MKNRVKSLLSVFLVMLIVLSCIQFGEIKSSAYFSEFYYSVISEEEKTCKITEYDGNAAELVIPSQLDGYTVTAIGKTAFCNFSSIVSVTVPDSVTQIERYAFYYCESLTDVNLPDSLTYIGDHVFEQTPFYYTESNWENGVLYIGKYLIEAKTELGGKYYVKNGTRVIADNGLSYTSVESVILPDGLITIGTGAFSGCSSLKRVVIPSSVNGIWDYAFQNCDNLTIYGYSGSYAQTHAEKYGIPFAVLGDADADGTINSEDYASLRESVMCRRALTEEQRIAADFNGDGTVDAFDVIALDLFLNACE